MSTSLSTKRTYVASQAMRLEKKTGKYFAVFGIALVCSLLLLAVGAEFGVSALAVAGFCAAVVSGLGLCCLSWLRAFESETLDTNSTYRWIENFQEL